MGCARPVHKRNQSSLYQINQCYDDEILVGGSCFKCPQDQTIVNNSCTKTRSKFCTAGYSYKDLCVDACPRGYFSNQKACVKRCPFHLVGYRGACQQNCPNEFYNSSSVCVRFCPDNKVVLGDQCVDFCPDGRSFSSNLSSCKNLSLAYMSYNMSCKFPYFKIDSYCSLQCKSGQMKDFRNLKCINQDFDCPDVFENGSCVMACSGFKMLEIEQIYDKIYQKNYSYTQCTEVYCEYDEAYDPIAHQCVDFCDDERFIRVITKGNKKLQICDFIDENEDIVGWITQENSGIIQQECFKDQIKVGPHCIQPFVCGQEQLFALNQEVSRQSCIKGKVCPLGQFMFSGICVPHCYPFVAINKTCMLSCVQPLKLFRDSCVSQCPQDTLVYVNECVQKCPNHFYNVSRQCVASCPGDQYSLIDSCVAVCPEPLLYDQQNQQCVAACSTKQVKMVDACVSFEVYKYNFYKFQSIDVENLCGNQSLLLYNGGCVDVCPSDLIKQGHVCAPECLTGNFVAGENCTERCPDNWVIAIDGRTCVKECGKYQYKDVDRCRIGCAKGLLAQDNGECVARCAVGTFADVVKTKCAKTCPNGYFGEPVTSSCEKSCLVGFANPSSHQCVEFCASPLFGDLNAKKCVEKCPNGTLQDLSSRTCVSACGKMQFLLHGQCLDWCPKFVDLFSGKCLESCNGNYYYGTNICQHLELKPTRVPVITYHREIFLQLLLVVGCWIVATILFFLLKE